MNLTGIIELSKSISLKANCLNKEINIQINGFSGILLTPALSENFRQKKEDYRNPLIQPNRGILFKNIDWGEPYSWPDGQSSIPRFKIIIELTDGSNLEDIKYDLIHKSEIWIKRFEKNLFSIGLNIDMPSVEFEKPIKNNVEYYYDFQKDKGIKKLKSDKPEQIIIHLENAIDFNDLKNVLDATSQDKNLCLEYSLLKDSQISIRVKEYRKSILDSATAFEIGLSEYLKINLPIPQVDLLEKILKMNNSIQKKRELLNFTALKLPDYDYQKNLEELRNRAIHDGKPITKHEALYAYKIVDEALKFLISDILV